MIQDFFKFAAKSLKQRKIRSMLTVLGIFIAILTIFVLLSLSLGLNEYVNEQFTMLGTDKFFIMPKGQAGAPGSSGGAVELTTDDVKVIEKVSGVGQVAYFAIGNAKITFKDKTRYYMVMGMPIDNEKATKLVFEASNIGIEEGRFLKKGDLKKVMIGYNYKYKQLFDRPVRTGNKIELNGESFEVIGIVDQIGNPQDDQQIYLSYDDFKDLFGSGERVDYIYIQVKTGEDLKKVAADTEKKLMKHRDVDEDTVDFTVQTPEELMGSFSIILNILTAFLVGIGFISVVVGGIGIANTMYTSVLERKKDIGTMKAIGAKNSDILAIFVAESGILGLIGGALGLFFGILIAKLIEYIAKVYIGSDLLRASMDLRLLIGCLVFAFLIGIISGFIPSYQASRLRPVDTLRYE